MRSRGFTLLELLVALALSVVVAVLAYQSLTSAVNASARAAEVAQQVDELDRVWSLFERDVTHLVERQNTRFSAEEQTADGLWLLRFTRNGWVNPLGQARSELQAVGYRYSDGVLYRHYGALLNRETSGDERVREQTLLSGVKGIELRYFSQQWLDVWPAGSSGLPQAIEVTINVEGLGRARRVFL